MCRNSNISWDIIQSFSQTTDTYEFASYNPNITIDIVNQYPDKPWSYYCLAANERKLHFL